MFFRECICLILVNFLKSNVCHYKLFNNFFFFFAQECTFAIHSVSLTNLVGVQCTDLK